MQVLLLFLTYMLCVWTFHTEYIAHCTAKYNLKPNLSSLLFLHIHLMFPLLSYLCHVVLSAGRTSPVFSHTETILLLHFLCTLSTVQHTPEALVLLTELKEMLNDLKHGIHFCPFTSVLFFLLLMVSLLFTNKSIKCGRNTNY